MQDSVPNQPYQDPEGWPPKVVEPEPTGSAPRSGSGKAVRTLVPIAIALVVGLVAGYLMHGSSTKLAAGAGPTVTVIRTVVASAGAGLADGTSPTDSSSATASPSAGGPSGSAAASTGPDVTGLGTASLINLTPVSGNFDNSDAKPTLNGQPQILALTQSLGIATPCRVTSATTSAGISPS